MEIHKLPAERTSELGERQRRGGESLGQTGCG